MKLPLAKDTRRILDFDIENMPITYYAPDYPTARITAIAWAWTDQPKDIKVRVLRPEEAASYESMLYDFLEAYLEADMVTGHYIRRHDLPIVNGALVELGYRVGLDPKMTSDTKMDLVKFSAIPKNQEFLEAIMGTKQQKVAMTQYDWRQANTFTKDGILKTIERVTSDVRGHMQMRRELVNRGLLRAPRLWRPN